MQNINKPKRCGACGRFIKTVSKKNNLGGTSKVFIHECPKDVVGFAMDVFKEAFSSICI